MLLTLEMILTCGAGWTKDELRHNCHAASFMLLEQRLVRGRVARGWCRGVGGQHSWVVVGPDVYDPRALIVDPTLWSYDPEVQDVWIGTNSGRRHMPHGGGQPVLRYPASGGGEHVELTPEAPLSPLARLFLEGAQTRVGPLDRKFWSDLVHGSMVGWPAGEIVAAVHATRELTALVPIDILGMLTDNNPGGLYLANGETAETLAGLRTSAR